MIFLDLDGVLANFVKAARIAHGIPWGEEFEWDFWHSWGLTDSEFWSKCSGIKFWSDIDPFDHTRLLYETCNKRANTFILTAPTKTAHAECCAGKSIWCQRVLKCHPQHVLPIYDKWLVSGEGRLLIDDKQENCESWERHGGKALLWRTPHSPQGLCLQEVIDYIESL